MHRVHLVAFAGFAWAVAVSILTRCMHRVHPSSISPSRRYAMFQSSPGACTGCISSRLPFLLRPGSFNPHPVHAPGASSTLSRDRWTNSVSILTRCMHRVHRCGTAPLSARCRVSILTRCMHRVHRVLPLPNPPQRSFNPHPVHAPGASVNC